MPQSDPTTELYFEAHVTVEPVFGERLGDFRILAEAHSFRVADLLMQKREEDTPERSRYDTFCTARGTAYGDVAGRTAALVTALRGAGFAVWRYKIENTLVDSRSADTMELLK